MPVLPDTQAIRETMLNSFVSDFLCPFFRLYNLDVLIISLFKMGRSLCVFPF